MNITVANRFFASVLLFCVTTTQAQYLVPRSQIEDFDSKALGAAPKPPAPTLIPIGMLLLPHTTIPLYFALSVIAI